MKKRKKKKKTGASCQALPFDISFLFVGKKGKNSP